MSRPHPTIGGITVTAHPPERGGPSSLGALIGAAVAPAVGARRRDGPRTQEEEDYADFAEARGRGHGPSAVRIYWLSVLILGSLVMAGGGVMALANGRGDLTGGLLGAVFVIIMLLPALLLLAALVTAVVLGVSTRPDKAREFGQLGRIAVGVFIGALAGTAPMVGLYLLLTNR